MGVEGQGLMASVRDKLMAKIAEGQAAEGSSGEAAPTEAGSTLASASSGERSKSEERKKKRIEVLKAAGAGGVLAGGSNTSLGQ